MAHTDTIEYAAQDDLRKRRQGRLIDQILQRAIHLPDDDRRLVEAVYRDGATMTDVARTAMLGRANPAGEAPASPTRTARMLRRRLRRIVARLTDPQALAYFREGQQWPHSRRVVAQAVLVQGLPQRTAARKLGMSLHTIRKQLDQIRVLVESSDHPSAGAA